MMTRMRDAVRTLFALVSTILSLAAWSAWIIMLGIGALHSLGVVNATISFHEAIPLGFGFVALGVLPIGMVLASSVENRA